MSLPQSRDDLAALIPHQGTMCLWQRVVACTPDSIDCLTASHRDPAHPLRRQGRLHAVHLVEYGAQLMAIHGALTGGAAGKPGVLAAVRDAQLAADFIDELADDLRGSARRLLAQDSGSLYECWIRCGTVELMRARIAVMHP